MCVVFLHSQFSDRWRQSFGQKLTLSRDLLFPFFCRYSQTVSVTMRDYLELSVKREKSQSSLFFANMEKFFLHWAEK